MNARFIRLLLMALLSGASLAPQWAQAVEFLDERTGMTIAALQNPIAFLETGLGDLLGPEKQAGMVYAGPVELDRSGDLTYGLWLQVAPGVDGRRLDDLRTPGTVTLKIDGKILTLTALELPQLATSPYSPVAPVGQMAYFSLDEAMLKRIVGTKKIVLNLRAADLTVVDYVPVRDTRRTFEQFMQDRGIATH